MDMPVYGILKTNAVRRLPDNRRSGKTGKGRQARPESWKIESVGQPPGFDSPRPTKQLRIKN